MIYKTPLWSFQHIKSLNGIFIDSARKSVKIVTIGNIREEFKKALSFDSLDYIYLENDAAMVIDKFGLLNENHKFGFNLGDNTVIGNAIIFSLNKNGDPCDLKNGYKIL